MTERSEYFEARDFVKILDIWNETTANWSRIIDDEMKAGDVGEFFR